MRHQSYKLLLILVLVLGIAPLLFYVHAQTTYTCTSSILWNFNSTPIPAGSSIWFSAVLLPSGTPTSVATISPTYFMISLGQQSDGIPYQCHNFPPVNSISFFSAGEPQLTYFDASNSWQSSVPLGLGGNTFLAGCTLPPCTSGDTWDCVPATGLPGGVPATWTMVFTSTVNQPIVWRWGAAVYSSFAPCKEAEECQGFGALGIKGVDNSSPSLSCVDSSSNCVTFSNSDPAGTPENYKTYLVSGGTGNGGSNYIGDVSYAPTATCTPY